MVAQRATRHLEQLLDLVRVWVWVRVRVGVGVEVRVRVRVKVRVRVRVRVGVRVRVRVRVTSQWQSVWCCAVTIHAPQPTQPVPPWCVARPLAA